jgi:isopentenyldiphosphate isomerase
MERFDIYDKNRKLTGRTVERGQKLAEDEYHLVIHVSILNAQNELLIQQRQAFKTAWPDIWDLSVSGSAQAGEMSQEAAVREVLEELGLRIDLRGVAPYFMVNFDHAFHDQYILFQDVDLASLHLQESEVQAVKWASHEEVKAMVAAGTFFPYQEPILDMIFSFGTSRR